MSASAAVGLVGREVRAGSSAIDGSGVANRTAQATAAGRRRIYRRRTRHVAGAAVGRIGLQICADSPAVGADFTHARAVAGALWVAGAQSVLARPSTRRSRRQRVAKYLVAGRAAGAQRISRTRERLARVQCFRRCGGADGDFKKIGHVEGQRERGHGADLHVKDAVFDDDRLLLGVQRRTSGEPGKKFERHLQRGGRWGIDGLIGTVQ